MTTKDEIQTSINSRLISKPTLIEGGTIQDVVGSVSYELANIIDTRIKTILDNAFVATCDEEHLIIKGSELGIYKKEATYATVTVEITGASANVEVNEEILAKTNSDVVFKVKTPVYTDSNGSAITTMVCISSGEIGNIEEDELNEFYMSYIGFENANIRNIENASGGYEEETIEEYRERILEYMRDDACNSNIADYTLWAKSVSGVKNVVVEDATIAGAGNVNVYISAQNDAEVTLGLIQSVENYIREHQIINANLTVSALSYKNLNITAEVVYEDNADADTVINNFKNSFKKYLSTKPSIISYLYVSNLLFETEGILDVTSYLLNNDTESIQIQKLEVPTIGQITLEEGD